MVDTDDTHDGRRMTEDGRKTMPGLWHKLPTEWAKKLEETLLTKCYCRFSCFLQSNFTVTLPTSTVY